MEDARVAGRGGGGGTVTLDEALAWLRGERSLTNIVPQHPHETWLVRIAEADAAATQRAYWIARAHTEGLVPDGAESEVADD